MFAASYTGLPVWDGSPGVSAAAGAIVLGLALLSGACASTGAVPRPFPGPPPTPATPATPPAIPREAAATDEREPGAGWTIVGTAMSLRGAPYRNGGADPAGFDCSGFVSYVFGRNGVPVPRTVADLYRAGTEVEARDLQPGDLVFFDTSGGVSHVGIAIGGDEFVHAPSTSGEVRVERLGTSYWSRRYVGARRLL